ncbi:MAG: efflux RND transporter permease subunit [Deltaproteobacteria bacterium]
MTLSDLSIKNHVFAWMLMIGILVFGWIGFSQMGVSQLPDVDFPVVTVSITWQGAAPEVMETDVTDIVEDAVMSVEGIREVTSTSSRGRAQIAIEFNLNRDIDVALQEVQTKISQAQRNLPTDIDPPVVTKTNPEDQPIMFLAVYGDKTERELSHYVSDTLKDQLTTVAGVGQIGMQGYKDPNLRVWLDSKKMKEREVTVEDVLAAINSQHADQPAGFIDSGPKEINLRVYGEAGSPDEFQHIVIPQRVRGGPVWNNLRIGDVGRVEDGIEDIRRIARASGQNSIGLGIIKQRGTNAVSVAKGVYKRLAEIQKTLPEGIHAKVVFDTTEFIKQSVDELKKSLILSVILTSIVCYFFLGSWTATINVLLAIPTSLMGAFLVLFFMGFTINTFTMLGLSLVIGIVVDDAIMVLENIARYQEQGKDKVEAALIGAREITFAALAASLAILAIFVPVIFMQGIVGKYFFQFGITISVAVLFSLLEALTIAPMRCSQFLDVGHTTKLGKAVEHFLHGVTEGYRKTLSAVLDSRKLVLVLAVAIFVGSMGLTGLLKKEFVPSQDMGRFLVRIFLPLGSSLEKTNGVFKQAESYLLSCPEVKEIFGAIGGGGSVNTGMIFITLKEKKDRPIVNGHHETQQEFMQVLRKKLNAIPGVERAGIQDFSQAGFSTGRGFPIEFTVRGPDWDKLGSLSLEMVKQMKASGVMTDVDTDYLLGMPELQIHPDREKASQRGVSIISIADTINAMVGGIRNGKFTNNGKRYDVRVSLADVDRSNIEDVNKLWVRNQFGEVVPLSEVTTSEVKPTLASVTRKNRERAVTIYANPAPGHTQQEALTKLDTLAKKVLPDGYRIVLSGGSQAFKESNQSLIFALVLGIFVAYMVLASQFNSFMHPFTVLLALPFSVTGAFIALWLCGVSLNLYSMIGLILLMGIVKKNSILLVDFTNVRRQQGKGVREALLEACPIRLRPILMTSVATVAAAVPIALATGSGSETMRPMALTIIGGVTVSTLLTLFVVPCAYYVASRFEKHRQ